MRDPKKLVDTWYFTYKGVTVPEPDLDADPDAPQQVPIVQGQKVKVEVRLIKELDEESEPPLSPGQFRSKLPHRTQPSA